MTPSVAVPSAPTTATGEGSRVRQHAAFCALAAALLAYLFRDQILHGYVLGQADILYDFLPWAAHKPLKHRIHNRLLADVPMAFYPFLLHARESVLNGQFPLWTTGMGAGLPFFASFQSAVLSPFTTLHYVLPFPASLTADVALRLWVGGLGMYVYLRALPLSHWPATFGGVAFLLNPFSIVWLEHPHSAAAAWLPWLLWAVDRVTTRPGGRPVALLALLTAAALLAGHPETTFKAVLLAAAYALYRGIATQRPARALFRVGTALLLGALLASVQILPFLEYARESRLLAQRRDSDALLTSPLAAFVTTFVPDFYGTPLRNRFVLGGTNYFEQQVYPGLVTWVFAAVALTHRSHRGRTLFFLVSGAIAMLIMYGTVVTRVATMLIPPLRVAALSRFGLLAIIGVIVAAAVGVDRIFNRDPIRPPPPKDRSAALAAGAALVIAAIVAAFVWVQYDLLVEARQWRQAILELERMAALLMAAVTLVFVSTRLPRRTTMALAVVLLSLDLIGFADGFHAAIPRAQAFPPLPELAIPQADRGLFRVTGWVDTLLPNTASVYELQDFRGYDGIGIRSYADLLDVGFHFNGATHQLVDIATPHLLDLLNIKYILTPPEVDLPQDRFRLVHEGPTRLYENQRVQARAFLVSEVVELVGNAARRAMRSGLDLRRVAIVDRSLPPTLQPDRTTADQGTAEMLVYSPLEVLVRTRAHGRRVLVLSDVYYPGWIATVDGEPATIYKADYAFRGVSVPAGEHVVRFHYQPRSVRYGAYASLVTAVLVVGLMVERWP